MNRITSLASALLLAQAADAYNVEATVRPLANNTWELAIQLCDNDIDLTAFQLDLAMEGDVTFSEKQMSCSTIMSNHALGLGSIDGHYRVVGYSEGNTSFSSREGSLFKFTIAGDFTSLVISNIVFADEDCKEYTPSQPTFVLGGEDIEDGVTHPLEEVPARYDIYNLSGQRVNIGQNGIYIVNGKKVLIKK